MWNQNRRRNPKSRNRYQPQRVAGSASSTTDSTSSCTDEGACHEEKVEDLKDSSQDLNESGTYESILSPCSEDPTVDVAGCSNDVQVPPFSSNEHVETENLDFSVQMSETIFDKSPKGEQDDLIFNVQDDSFHMRGSVDSVKVHVNSSVEEFNSEASESEDHAEATNLIKPPQDSTNTVSSMDFCSELLKQENELDLSIQNTADASLIEIDSRTIISYSVEDEPNDVVAEPQRKTVSTDENEKSLEIDTEFEKSSSKVSDLKLDEESCKRDKECLPSELNSNSSKNLQNQTDTSICDHKLQEEINGKLSPLKPTLLIQKTGDNDEVEIKNTVKKIIASLEISIDKNGKDLAKDKACVDSVHQDDHSNKMEPKRVMLDKPDSENVVPIKRFKTGYFTETSGADLDQSVVSNEETKEEIDDSEMPDLIPVLESELEPIFTPNLDIDRVFDFLAWERVSVDIDARLLAASVRDLDGVVIALGENLTSSTQNLFNNGPVLKKSDNSNDSETSSSSDDSSKTDSSEEVNSDVTMQAKEESDSDESDQQRPVFSNRKIHVESASFYDRTGSYDLSTESSSDDTMDDSCNENLICEQNNPDFEQSSSSRESFNGMIADPSCNQDRLNMTYIFKDLITAIFEYFFYSFLALLVLFVTWIRNQF